MASSVEVRAPFLDKEIMALSMTLSDSDLVVEGCTKHVLMELFAVRFPAIKAQDRTIGFRVPCDEMFLPDRTRPEVEEHCELGAQALHAECGLRLTSLTSITPRLGWSLLNIGIFLDTLGYGS